MSIWYDCELLLTYCHKCFSQMNMFYCVSLFVDFGHKNRHYSDNKSRHLLGKRITEIYGCITQSEYENRLPHHTNKND